MPNTSSPIISTFKWAYRIFGAILFLYVLWRAVAISFTPDESISYFFVTGKYDHLFHSNNHLLNTQLMRLANAVFGPWEWSLRLPNVLSFLVFLHATSLILKRSKYRWSALIGVVVIVLNPFMLEFFSLARGYGLSIAFSTLAFAKLIEGRRPDGDLNRSHFAVVIYSFLAVLSNLNAINFVLLLFFWVVVDQARFARRWKRSHMVLGLMMAAVIGLTIGALLVLRSNNDLLFGAPSYYAAFIRTARVFIYVDDQPIWFTEIIGVGVGLLFVSIAAIVCVRRRFTSDLAVALSLLIGIPIGWVLEHIIFGANLPQGRLLLNVLPVMGFVIFFFVDGRGHWSNKVIGGFLTLMYILNFGLSLNVSTTHKWPDSSKTKEAITYVGEIVRDWEQPATLERFNIYRNSTNYYISTRELNIELNEDRGIKGEADMLFVHMLEWEKVKSKLGDRYTLIWSEPNYPMRVYQNNITIRSGVGK